MRACPDCGHQMIVKQDKNGSWWACTSCPYDEPKEVRR